MSRFQLKTIQPTKKQDPKLNEKDNFNPKRTEMLEFSDKDLKAAMEMAAVTNKHA